MKMSSAGHKRVGRLVAVVAAGLCGLSASAQTLEDFAAFPGFRQGHPQLTFPLPPQMTSIYWSGQQEIADQLEERWRPMCFNRAPISADELRGIRQTHRNEIGAGDVTIVDTPSRSAGINIVFVLGGSVPAPAIPSFAAAEAYLESQFSDPITVTVNVTFANLGSGVIGATGSNFINNRTYTNVRNGLVNGMDANDTIQAILPPVPSVPVRYNGNSATVTNETLIDLTWANFKATVGSLSGSDGDMTYNSAFNFDYDPSNGVGGTQISLVDVIIHEVGHALGFVSAADNQAGGQFAMMDLYRFQRTDGTGNFNPDTNAQFTTTARLVHYNTPNDDHNTDFIWAEYRMSDGTPYQASHFREQSANIGIMDPAFANGQTFYPNFFKTSDLDVFDAMGYDYPPGGGGCTGITITQQPLSQSVCPGSNVTFTVTASGTDPIYQWRKDFVVIPGATSSSLTLTGVTSANAGNYTVSINNDCSSTVLSSIATLTIKTATSVTTPPSSLEVDEGDLASFNVVAAGTNLTYQWRKNFVVIPGAESSTYTIPVTTASDAGSYRVTVTGDCGVVTSAEAILTVNQPGPGCAADYNGDGEFDILDFLDFLDDFGQCENQPGPCGLHDADFNGDTFVDVLDFLDFLDAFGTGCG
ncbi:MAG: NF038122 family metalloprotease [Phycisphaeraceae bacterium]|nr:NF038122 family metalloprotease [Phycisphaeraceae bacterium]